MRALHVATTGMLAQQMHIEVTSNNLANMTTTAYKRQKIEFQDLIYQNQQRVGTQSSDVGTIVPAGIQLGLGVKPGAINRINEQATMSRTENQFDLAINGRGYFQIEMPDGEIYYTRDGTFKMSEEGEIVTSDGYLLLPGVVIPEDALDVTINRSGEVIISLEGANGEITNETVGQIELAQFINEAGLQAAGGNLFQQTDASGDPLEGIAGEENFGEIFQGFVESSNVNPVDEITNLILAQRAYEMNAKVITTAEEMMQAASSAKR